MDGAFSSSLMRVSAGPLLRAAAAAAYLAVLAAAAPHQVHHAGERLTGLLHPRPAAHSHDHHQAGHEAWPQRHHRPGRPAAGCPAPAAAACPLESALAWKGGELPAPAPAGPPDGITGTVAPSALLSHAAFALPSRSPRAPPATVS